MHKIHGKSSAMSSTKKKNFKISSSISISFEWCNLASENWKMCKIWFKIKVCNHSRSFTLRLWGWSVYWNFGLLFWIGFWVNDRQQTILSNDILMNVIVYFILHDPLLIHRIPWSWDSERSFIQPFIFMFCCIKI